MSRERLYGLSGVKLKKPLSGQALLVFQGMNERVDGKDSAHAFKTPKEWTVKIGPKLVTRQDTYRVVLYYILIFKNRGLVAVREQEPVIDEVTAGEEIPDEMPEGAESAESESTESMETESTESTEVEPVTEEA